MLKKTHSAVGVATALAVIRPNNLVELVVGTGIASIGALICDIDVGTSESHKDADKITFFTVLAIIVIAVLESMFQIGIYQSLMKNASIARIISGSLIFIGVCAVGKEQPHRSFMHSLLALAILSVAVYIIYPIATPYFAVGFASHIAIDLLNFKKVKVLYPLKAGFSLKLCKAGGIVNHMLGTGATVLAGVLVISALLKMGK